MKLSKKFKLMTAIGVIAFIAYNVVFFVLCGFTDHTAVFWTSWAFMLVAFAGLACSAMTLGKNGLLLRDWLFGYPIIKHSVIYIVVEFILSTVLIIFEYDIELIWAFTPQFILLAVYLMLLLSGFLAKATIEEVNTKVGDKTRFIKLLRVDSERLVQKCDDPTLKEACRKFSEAVRYSDPMSNEALFELEKELVLTVSNCSKAISEKNYAEAGLLCQRASDLLDERNMKCKALK